MCLAGFVPPSGLGRDAGSVQQLDAIGRLRRDLERLVQERERLVMRMERGRTIGGRPECDASLGCDRGAFVALGAGPVRVQVVRREDAGDLVIVEAFEIARRRQVPRAAVPAREGPVRDLSDEPMDEAVLPALRRPRVHVELEELAPDEIAKPGLERLRILPRHGGAPVSVKLRPSTAASWTSARSAGSRLSRRAAISAWRDSGISRWDRSPTGR